MKNIRFFYLKFFSILEMKFSIYLNRCVFVMVVFFAVTLFRINAIFSYILGTYLKLSSIVREMMLTPYSGIRCNKYTYIVTYVRYTSSKIKSSANVIYGTSFTGQ